LADISEPLREKHGDDQVNQQENGESERDCGNEVHGLPQLLAGLDVEKPQAEQNGGEKQHRQILHIGAPGLRSSGFDRTAAQM